MSKRSVCLMLFAFVGFALLLWRSPAPENKADDEASHSPAVIKDASGESLSSESVAAESTVNTLADLARKTAPSVFLVKAFDREHSEIATGTGFTVTRDGLLVTNYHVIADAHSAEAVTHQGARFRILGVVVSSEPDDIVLLRLDGKDLPFLNVAEFDQVEVGQSVAVFGNPVGRLSLSEGIVASLDDLRQDGRETFFQLTAPISPGSSGSPVLDRLGNVIGVATLASTGRLQNMNFAVRSSALIPLLHAANHIEEAEPFMAEDVAASDFDTNLTRSDEIFSSAEYSEFEAASKKGDELSRLEAAKRLSARFPDNPSAQFCLGLAFSSLDLHNQAIEAYRKSIENSTQE